MRDDGSHLSVLAQLEKLYGIELYISPMPLTHDEAMMYYFTLSDKWRMPTPVDSKRIHELDACYNTWVEGDMVQLTLSITRPHIKRMLVLIKRVDNQ
jgi:hypothetical protein